MIETEVSSGGKAKKRVQSDQCQSEIMRQNKEKTTGLVLIDFIRPCGVQRMDSDAIPKIRHLKHHRFVF